MTTPKDDEPRITPQEAKLRGLARWRRVRQDRETNPYPDRYREMNSRNNFGAAIEAAIIGGSQ